MLWTAYLNGGQSARGAEFARAVREIAARVGIDVESAPVRQRRDRRGDLLEHFFELCLEEIMSAEGASARTNLGERGLAGGRASGLGMVPAAVRTRAALSELGYTSGEIDRSGVVADSRWSGRICGAWRDESGRVRTMWARAVYGDGADARYLYLRGAPRGGLPPYDCRTSSTDRRTCGATLFSSRVFSTYTSSANDSSTLLPESAALALRRRRSRRSRAWVAIA